MAFKLVRDPITGLYDQVEIVEEATQPEEKIPEVLPEVKSTPVRPQPVHKKVK